MYAAAIGSWSENDEKCLVAAAAHTSTHIDFTSLDAAARSMEDHATEARCVFIPHDADVTALVSRLRARASLLTVPVIAVVPHPTEALYRTAFASGADDALVSGDRGGITRRLASLEACKPKASTSRNQGLALVASGDIGMRRTLGQTLRRAGFDVAYATDQRELLALTQSTGALSLVVATTDFAPRGAEAAILELRTGAQKPSLPVLVVSSDADSTLDIGTSDDMNATSQLLCFAEEVSRRDGTELRASARLPHATITSFRPAGILQPSYGQSHNISREGLFIRTLDAPKPGSEVWIELRAPETSAMVHLRGQVVWRREPGAVGATPFGFGMRLATGRCPTDDLVAYCDGYERSRALQTTMH